MFQVFADEDCTYFINNKYKLNNLEYFCVLNYIINLKFPKINFYD